MHKLFVALVSTLVLFGCAGCGSSNHEEDSVKTEITQDNDEGASSETATANQYASIVAKNGDISDEITNLKKCNWLADGPLATDANSACGIELLTLSFQSATLRLEFVGAMKEDAPAYIGAPPKEISTLVDDTRESAEALHETAEKLLDQSCDGSGAGQCGKLRVQTLSAMTDLERNLRTWGPYL